VAWFLPVRVEHVPLHILGLWACVKDRRLRYVRVAHRAIDHYVQFLSVPHMIAIGDFISNTGRYREHSHSQLVAKLGRLGLVSACHNLRGKLQGQEATPTWFLYRHLAFIWFLVLFPFTNLIELIRLLCRSQKLD
jgi:hypothetical protein